MNAPLPSQFLADRADKAAARRFTGESITGFGSLDALPPDNGFLQRVIAAQHGNGLGILTYADLVELEGEYSEDGDSFELDDVRRELDTRLTAAKVALITQFHEAVQSRGTLPWIEGAKLGCILISVWLDEGAGAPPARRDYTAMLLEAGARDRVLISLAIEYANDNAEDLLRAGWKS